MSTLGKRLTFYEPSSLCFVDTASEIPFFGILKQKYYENLIFDESPSHCLSAYLMDGS